MAKQPDIKQGDLHLIVNDWESRFIGEAKCYNSQGKQIWKIPALAKGVDGPRSDIHAGDTPPGLYLAGQIYETMPHEPEHIWRSYGKWCVDMVEQEGQEAGVGRAGICLHGGGSGLPDPLADYQELIPTFGCVRMHNRDLDTVVIPCLKAAVAKGYRMWITVNQLR